MRYQIKLQPISKVQGGTKKVLKEMNKMTIEQNSRSPKNKRGYMHQDCLQDSGLGAMSLKEIKLTIEAGLDRLKREQTNFKNYNVINEKNEQKWLKLMRLNFKLKSTAQFTEQNHHQLFVHNKIRNQKNAKRLKD